MRAETGHFPVFQAPRTPFLGFRCVIRAPRLPVLLPPPLKSTLVVPFVTRNQWLTFGLWWHLEQDFMTPALHQVVLRPQRLEIVQAPCLSPPLLRTKIEQSQRTTMVKVNGSP